MQIRATAISGNALGSATSATMKTVAARDAAILQPRRRVAGADSASASSVNRRPARSAGATLPANAEMTPTSIAIAAVVGRNERSVNGAPPSAIANLDRVERVAGAIAIPP